MIPEFRERNITHQVADLLHQYGVPHVILKAPIGVRTYPPDVYSRIRIQDFLSPDIYTEEIMVGSYWFDEMDDLHKALRSWNQDTTMFFYFASERFEILPGSADNALDLMAVWLRTPKVYVRYHVSKISDVEWNSRAQAYIAKMKAKKALPHNGLLDKLGAMYLTKSQE